MHSQRITVDWNGKQWVVGDEGGEFARADTAELAIPYVRDLMYGPATTLADKLERWRASRMPTVVLDPPGRFLDATDEQPGSGPMGF